MTARAKSVSAIKFNVKVPSRVSEHNRASVARDMFDAQADEANESEEPIALAPTCRASRVTNFATPGRIRKASAQFL